MSTPATGFVCGKCGGVVPAPQDRAGVVAWTVWCGHTMSVAPIHPAVPTASGSGGES